MTRLIRGIIAAPGIDPGFHTGQINERLYDSTRPVQIRHASTEDRTAPQPIAVSTGAGPGRCGPGCSEARPRRVRRHEYLSGVSMPLAGRLRRGILRGSVFRIRSARDDRIGGPGRERLRLMRAFSLRGLEPPTELVR